MTNWMFLSKNNQDEYINFLAASVGLETFDYDYFDYHYDVEVDHKVPVLRGILKHKIMKQCLKGHNDFYYVDSGYFGNQVSARNPRGTKLWHRIVKNGLQQNFIRHRPSDRWQNLNIEMQARKYGSKIIIAAPDEKPCKYYNIDRGQWLNDTVNTLKQFTDREIIVRERAAKRQERVHTDPLSQVLQHDVHAVVTFNSIAAAESIVMGVPAFVLAPGHCAEPVANTDLTKIEDPYWPDQDRRMAWAHSLAYGQYHVSELKNGDAIRMMQE